MKHALHLLCKNIRHLLNRRTIKDLWIKSLLTNYRKKTILHISNFSYFWELKKPSRGFFVFGLVMTENESGSSNNTIFSTWKSMRLLQIAQQGRGSCYLHLTIFLLQIRSLLLLENKKLWSVFLSKLYRRKKHCSIIYVTGLLLCEDWFQYD